MKKDSNTSEKSKILMRTYITSLLSLMLCVTMLLGTTYAWFTSEVQTGGNSIAVGTLKVDLQNGKGASLKDVGNLFGSGSFKWEPGATKIETFKLVNLGDLAFDYALYLSPINAEVGDLLTAGKFIDVYITTNGAEAKTVEQLKNNWIRVGNLADVAQNGYMLVNGSWTPNTPAVIADEPGTLATVKIALHLPSNVSDEDIMGATITNLGVKLMATQKPFEADDIEGDHDSEAAVVVNVSNQTELAAAFNEGKRVNLTSDIVIDENTTLTVPTGKQVVINMNGKDITSTSTGGSGNKEMFLVKGNLIIKGKKAAATTAAEGETASYESVISYTHTGTNMGWNAMTTIFDVTAGGVLQLEDVKVVNNGGTDMNFVAHLNNWGTASLYTEGCHLEAGYCAVRVFNSGPDVNNFVAKHTTLKGKHAFWVHNYTSVDFGDKLYSGASAPYDKAAVDARLNVNIYNGNNEIQGNVIYGFTGTEYHVTSGNALVAAAKADVAKIVLQENVTLTGASVEVAKDVTMILDLNGHKIEATYNNTGATAAIVNKGTLTIEDATGNGTIELKGAVISADNGYATNTITNHGTLTVNGGNIINNLNGASYAIDNNSGATAVINGGYIYNSHANGTAIRAYGNSDTEVSKVEIKGGTIKGGYGVRLHNLSTTVASKIELTVNGGTLIGTDETYHMALYSLCNDGTNVKVALNGGTYEGNVAFGGGNKAAPETVTITKEACTFKAEVFSYNTNVTNNDNLLK